MEDCVKIIDLSNVNIFRFIVSNQQDSIDDLHPGRGDLSRDATLLLCLGIVISVIVIRVRKFPRPEGSFRIPGGFLVPILAGTAILWFLSNLSRKEMIAIVSIIVVLTLIYFALLGKRKKSVK